MAYEGDELEVAPEEVDLAGAKPGNEASFPQFFELLRPLLEVLADGRNWKLPDAAEAVAELVGLSEEARSLQLPNGRRVFENRVRWAFTNLSKAELADLVAPSTVRITDDGRAALATEEEIDRDFLLRTRPSYAAWHVDMGIEEPKTESSTGGGVWMVRAGRSGVHAPHFVRRAAAVVGWGETGDVSGLSREAIANRVSTAFTHEGARQRGQATNTLYHLSQTMGDGDLVVTPEPSSRTLLLGRVSGPYRYLEDPIAPNYNHAREVYWFARVPRDELSYGARNSLGSLLTLSRPGHQGELVRLAEDHREDASPEPLEQARRATREVVQAWASVAIPEAASVDKRAALPEFQTYSRPLLPMLDQLHSGELALPDFQRSFVWEPAATRELIVSMIRGFPAGNLLFLQGGSARFRARTAEGASEAQMPPSYLVLDGQQRLTSLYQALFGVGQSRFFLDIGGLLRGAEVDESVRVFQTDRAEALSAVETQASALVMPLPCVRAGDSVRWIHNVVRARDEDDPDRVVSLLYDVQQAYVDPLVRYAFPVTVLPESTELEAVCTIFETLNRTGKPLTTFELISARAFAGGLSLNDKWTLAKAEHPNLEDFDVDPVYLLQVVALRLGPQCRKSVLLRLPAEAIEREWGPAVSDMGEVLSMLRNECGVLVSRWLPYRPMLIPLAVAWREIANGSGPGQGAMRAKLVQWFWCAAFTGEYESSSATLAERDGPALRAWLRGGEAPRVVQEFSWDPERWRTVSPRQQGLYRATVALILGQAPRDFHTGAPLSPELIEEQRIDDHHIFPRAYLREIGRGGEVDSVLNHALIDRTTNVRIGKNPPSTYLAEIRAVLGGGLDGVLSSHRLPTGPDSPLTNDDFDAFLTWRLEHLHELLEARAGPAEAPKPSVPSYLRTLDTRIEQIELALRELIRDRLDENGDLLPAHVTERARERIADATRKQPAKAELPSGDLCLQLQYCDLRDLQDTLMTKALWPLFANLFVNKEVLGMRFGQLAELRNALRHSREVTAITRNDGEAAIHWFGGALALG